MIPDTVTPGTLLPMDFLKSLKKKKCRRILTLSAGSMHGGMHAVYSEMSSEGWHILHHQIVPYPAAIRPVIDNILFGNDIKAGPDAESLFKQISAFIAECARRSLSAVSRTSAVPDFTILDRLSLRQSPPVQNPGECGCSFPGDPQELADAIKSPVLADPVFFCQSIREDGRQSVLPGDFAIGAKAGQPATLVNIGVISHVSIIDIKTGKVITDSDAGPGTSLVNRAAEIAGCEEGFDRDGIAGAAGRVDTGILEKLANGEWFLRKAPKSLDAAVLDSVFNDSGLSALSPQDRLATLTAFTARSIFVFFKNNYPEKRMPDSIWISGGGTRNSSIMEHLKNFFSPIQVRSVEELEVPAESRFPLALALSVDFCVSKHTRLARSGITIPQLQGAWFLPRQE